MHLKKLSERELHKTVSLWHPRLTFLAWRKPIEYYYWPITSKYVKKWVDNYEILQHAKGKSQNTRLYKSFLALDVPWEYINVNFVLTLSIVRWGNNSIFIVVYSSSKMTHLIACNKTSNDTLFFLFIFSTSGTILLHKINNKGYQLYHL